MNQTARVFARAGLAWQSIAIKRQSIAGLLHFWPAINRWAAEAGLDVRAALDADTHADRCDLIPLNRPVEADVVVPFCESDSKYLQQALGSLLTQKHARLTVHVVSDGARWPALPQSDTHRIVRYETPGDWGPYKIANAVSYHVTSDWIALQDADDISRPDRLWQQIGLAEQHGADMIGSAMLPFAETDGSDHTERMKDLCRIVTRPGTRFRNVPLGRSVNGTRTMRVAMFRRLNGFANRPCSVDFDFDNRVRYAGCPVHDCQVIHADRRVHVESMTQGRYVLGTDTRQRGNDYVMWSLQQMQNNPTVQMARKLGERNTAPRLDPQR